MTYIGEESAENGATKRKREGWISLDISQPHPTHLDGSPDICRSSWFWVIIKVSTPAFRVLAL
ncbi:MAG: hypothetical protein A2Y91_08050 [Chloroflexi bacterium RBG_13_54_8]|nr:MAG: hypothetical protein A2Y91_08050 [Chloroflexi bacterium RBG_13_54_8]